MGDAIAVKKALLAVSKCLQENPSLDKAQIVVSKPVGSGLHGSITDTRGSFPDTRGSFPDPHGEHFSHRNSFLSPTRRSSLDYVARGHTFPTAVQKISTLDQKNIQEEVAFRLLCPNDKVGGVIGKGGTIINALENETGASISVGSTMPGSEERLITITAMEVCAFSDSCTSTILHIFNGAFRFTMYSKSYCLTITAKWIISCSVVPVLDPGIGPPRRPHKALNFSKTPLVFFFKI